MNNLWLKPGTSETALSTNFAIKPSRRLGVAGLLGAALVACAWLFAGGAAPTANAQGGACANEDLRSQQNATHLPDCRAYEQVSPLYKNGNHIFLETPDDRLGPVIAAESGDRVFYSSAGVFGDIEGSSTANGYAGDRDGVGWLTDPLMPPGGEDWDPESPTDLNAVQGVTADLTKQLVTTKATLAPGATPGTRSIYVRDSADGSYRLAGTGLAENHTSAANGASPDGSRWFFQTAANLDTTPPPATPGSGAIRDLYEFDDGQINLAGVLPNGTAPPQGSVAGGHVTLRPASEDGSQIYWTTPASGASIRPVYLYRNGQSTLVSERETDGTTQEATFETATVDGSQAFLTSPNQLTADASPSGSDLYRYDRDVGPDGDLVDLTPTGSEAGVGAVLGVSEDGSHVYFRATGDLAPGATAGQQNIYVWHDDQIRLIATSAANLGRNNSRLSPNGNFFGFVIDGALAGPNPQPDPGAAQAYLYDFDEDTLACASCPDGTASGDAQLRAPRGNTNPLHPLDSNYRDGERNVLDDGRFFFESPDALVNGDSNGKIDVYQYDDADGGVSLLSTGQSPNHSFFGDATPDGDDVFIVTTSQLVAQDTDSLADLYDVKVEGGLASQNEVPEPECQGDECQGEPSGAPEDDDLGTGGQGAGNPDAEPACESQSSSVQRYGNRIQKLKSKKKQAQRKAKSSSGKKAKRARSKAKRIGKKIKKVRSKKRDAKRDLRSCREAK